MEMELGDQLIDIDDTALIPGIEWEFIVDLAQAAMLGANMAEIGTAIQLMTNGIFMGDYRPDDSEEEVDIRVRYPSEYRGSTRWNRFASARLTDQCRSAVLSHGKPSLKSARFSASTAPGCLCPGKPGAGLCRRQHTAGDLRMAG